MLISAVSKSKWLIFYLSMLITWILVDHLKKIGSCFEHVLNMFFPPLVAEGGRSWFQIALYNLCAQWCTSNQALAACFSKIDYLDNVFQNRYTLQRQMQRIPFKGPAILTLPKCDLCEIAPVSFCSNLSSTDEDWAHLEIIGDSLVPFPVTLIWTRLAGQDFASATNSSLNRPLSLSSIFVVVPSKTLFLVLFAALSVLVVVDGHWESAFKVAGSQSSPESSLVKMSDSVVFTVLKCSVLYVSAWCFLGGI